MMNRLDKRLVAVVLLLAPFFVLADGPVFEVGYNCTFLWNPPTTRTNGVLITPPGEELITPPEIAGYRLYLSKNPDPKTFAHVVTTTEVSVRCADTQIDNWSPGGFGVGQYYAAVTAVDANDRESDFSPIVPFVFRAPITPPSAPISFTVE